MHNYRYLAPEYIDGGRITEKVDLYAFGVTLLELITGQRTSQLQFYKSQHVLSDWFHPLAALQPDHIVDKVHRLIDPFLVSEQAHNYTHQLQAMARAAFLCLSRDPESRPPMSKVCCLHSSKFFVSFAIFFSLGTICLQIFRSLGYLKKQIQTFLCLLIWNLLETEVAICLVWAHALNLK